MPKASIMPTTSRRQTLRLYAASTLAGLLTPTLAVAATTDPDAELIRLCDRLVVVRRLENAAYDENPEDEETQDILTEPLNAEWHQIADRLAKLDSPRTPEGARAMALAALSEVPRNRDDTIDYGDLHSWLSVGCARYLAGEGV